MAQKGHEVGELMPHHVPLQQPWVIKVVLVPLSHRAHRIVPIRHPHNERVKDHQVNFARRGAQVERRPGIGVDGSVMLIATGRSGSSS